MDRCPVMSLLCIMKNWEYAVLSTSLMHCHGSEKGWKQHDWLAEWNGKNFSSCILYTFMLVSNVWIMFKQSKNSILYRNMYVSLPLYINEVMHYNMWGKIWTVDIGHSSIALELLTNVEGVQGLIPSQVISFYCTFIYMLFPPFLLQYKQNALV